MSTNAETLPMRAHTKRATVARVARGTLAGASLLAAVLGLFAHNAQVLPVHELLGDIALLSLWTLAVVAARAGVPRKTVVYAAALGAITLALAGAQKLALGSVGHVTTQVLHVASVIAVMVTGGQLARAVLRRDAAPRGTSYPTMAEAAAEFLASKRIAVTGVSRKADAGHGANVVYRRLRERGYEVFAVNPNASTVEGDRAYRDLRSIPAGVDAVVIATRPDRAFDTVRECAELGIDQVWMHHGGGASSVSPEATEWGRAHGIHVIDGGCPLMFGAVADTGHKVMCHLLTLTGRVPRHIPERSVS
jgi:predicted CoA-binding protein